MTDRLDETPLAGKVALVTGGSRGIGRAIALDLARAGAKVAVNYHSSPAAADEVCRLIAAAGGAAAAFRADVADVPAARAMFDAVERALGPVDILVNNAGIEPRMSIADTDESTYDALMNTNLRGAFFCAQRAVEPMKARGWGRIINISSVHEVLPHPPASVYSMTKAGMSQMTRELAAVYSRYGITINSVSPGAIRTDINRAVLADPEFESRVNARIPAGFIGEPEDVSRLVAFLAGEGGRYITGASLFVDGGLSL